MNLAEERIAAAPLPTSRTLRPRTFLSLQLLRFARFDLRTLWTVHKAH